MIRPLATWFVRVTKPWIQRMATAYELKVERPLWALGEHPLTFADSTAALQTIPRSTTFNTRSGAIHIGRDVVFGEQVSVLTGKHINIADAERTGEALHHVPDGGRDIVIGDGCYVGTGTIIVGPVRIGDHAVIGAGSVVTRDVAARSFVAGVPAKIVRML